MAAFSKEAVFVDNTIKFVLDLCFVNPKHPIDKKRAVQMFEPKIDSTCLFLSKVHMFKQAYDMKVSSVLDEVMMPIEVPQPSPLKLAHLYLGLIRGTLMNPSSVVVTCSNQKALGNIPPRLYVLCTMLAILSARRSYNDSILQPLLSGKSSCGKSKILDSFVSISKVVNSEAQGVGRYVFKNVF